MSAAICWSTQCDPTTLFNVGAEAIGLTSDNIVNFINLKTNIRSYCRVDMVVPMASIACINGHNRLPLYAFAEANLRPKVHVLRYPANTRFQSFPADCLHILDVRFSEVDHVIALGNGPLYRIWVWNIRNGNLMVEHETHVECQTSSLIISYHFNPMIAQFSNISNVVYVWQMSNLNGRHDLYNISQVKLQREHAKTSLLSMCFSDDGVLYVANDLGDVHSVDLSSYSLKREWTSSRFEAEERRPFRLTHSRVGLLISCAEVVYCIKKKSAGWELEWSVTKNCELIESLVANYNGSTYGTDIYGNVYHIELNADGTNGEWASLSYTCNNNFFVLDYALLRGIKEEFIVVLNSDGEVCLFEIFRMSLISVTVICGAVSVCVHNSAPFVVVGNMDGHLTFLSYEKPREPLELGTLQVKDDIEVVDMRYFDVTMMVRDTQDRFHIVLADCKKVQFNTVATMLGEPDNVMIVNYFLIDKSRALVFVNTNAEEALTEKCADEVWLYIWDKRVEHGCLRVAFKLPQQYKSFAISAIATFKENIEFFAIPSKSFNFDIFNLVHNRELIHTTSIQSHHIGYLSGILVGRNVCTWSTGRTCLHFKSHKKSPKPYMIARFVYAIQRARVVKRVEECFNAKYLVVFFESGNLRVFRLPVLSDNLRENITQMDTPVHYGIHEKTIKYMEGSKVFEVKPPTKQELKTRERLVQRLRDISQQTTKLINYDISVTQKTHGVYQKFCLNTGWLRAVKSEAQILCNRERETLMRCIADHARIRDWIRSVITRDTAYMGIKIMSLFANVFFESYSIVKTVKELAEMFDLYRFYDLEPTEDGDNEDDELDDEEIVAAEKATSIVEVGDGDGVEKRKSVRPLRHRFIIKGSAYEHIMSGEFLLQDKDNITVNQIHNSICKYRYVWINALKAEFNKLFSETRTLKQEIMDHINNTNSSLNTIHDNMNIMLRLLHMIRYKPPKLTVPEWKKEELLECIMEVDDSEIKAINRRKKKAEVAEMKRGRMLLWAVEFWARALMVMMDGVLEKLWEEEIKKDLPIPEFALKKNPHEFSLEEQRQFRQYEENVRLLQEDRRKYLRILKDRETKTLQLKNKFIMQLSEKCTQMALQKMKYDFAVKSIRVRSLNLKIKHNKRLDCLQRMKQKREDLTMTIDYIDKYAKVIDYYEKYIGDLKARIETLAYRDKQVDRQFKGQYLNSILATITHESTRLFKRRPKVPLKSLNSPLICQELASRLLPKSKGAELPLPAEGKELLAGLEAMDDEANMPHQMEPKYWDILVKLRRQKMEAELKLRAANLQLNDAQVIHSHYVRQEQFLKNTRIKIDVELEESKAEYDDIMNNQFLQITLTMGQVEVRFGGQSSNLDNCILMHIDDINDVNMLIKVAGEMKLMSMQKVARFRRRVIFKEWEHKTVKANINYLRYMLDVIEKCRVSVEFLNIIRNWKKVREQRTSLMAVGVIEKLIEKRIAQARLIIDVLNRKIEGMRDKIREAQQKTKQVNKQIENIKVDISLSSVHRDFLVEEKFTREQKERMTKIRTHRNLVDTVRADYVHIMELTTLLELQRLRTYPTLGPPPAECPE